MLEASKTTDCARRWFEGSPQNEAILSYPIQSSSHRIESSERSPKWKATSRCRCFTVQIHQRNLQRCSWRTVPIGSVWISRAIAGTSRSLASCRWPRFCAGSSSSPAEQMWRARRVRGIWDRKIPYARIHSFVSHPVGLFSKWNYQGDLRL
jgi:hypothetical protein